MTVAIPSMAYTGTVMTENAFYPLFLLVALVLVVVLERPSGAHRRRSATRSSASPSRPASRRSRWSARDSPGAAPARRVPAARLHGDDLALPLALRDHRRGSRRRGARDRSSPSGTSSAPTRRSESSRTTSRRCCATCGGTSRSWRCTSSSSRSPRRSSWSRRARSLDARLQPFLAATVALTVCVVPVVAAFAAEFSDRIQERNMFYVAPLLCIALLAWIERGAPRPRCSPRSPQ